MHGIFYAHRKLIIDIQSSCNTLRYLEAYKIPVSQKLPVFKLKFFGGKVMIGFFLHGKYCTVYLLYTVVAFTDLSKLAIKP
jgi:hypothetical protein